MPVMKPAVAVLLLAVAPLFAAEEPPLKGTFCLVAVGVAPKCRAVTGDVATVSPSARAQHFVWSSSDGKSIVAGTVAPKLESVPLREEGLRPVTLSLRGDRRHGWPAEVLTRVVEATGSEWTFTVPAKSVETLAQIRVPEGKYTLSFVADHHQAGQRRFSHGKGGTSLKEVMLRPMPVISGRVTTSKDEPIANAEVVRPDKKVIARSDEQGNFRAEAGEPLPDSVFLSKSGFGSRLMPLQPSSGDTDLGVVRLGRGMKMTLKIVRPESVRDPLGVELILKNEFQYDYTPATTKQLRENESTVAFEDLGKGTYLVVISGKGPSEKLTEEVAVDDSDVEKEIRIEPYRVEGSVRIGEDPLDGAIVISGSIIGTQSTHATRYSLPIENGRFAATFWQHGTISAWVNSGDQSVSQPVNSPALGDDPSVWNIQFPKRFITGRIFDAETHETIPQAKLDHLITTRGPTRLYGSTKIKDDGSFSILATGAGSYELKVSAPGYVGDKLTVAVHDEDASWQHDFALTHGTPATLEVVWPSGEPVVNAAVMEGVASDGHNAERHYALDASGRLTIRMRKGEWRTLFLVPREGSFAVAHVTAPGSAEATPVRLVVPRPAGGLHVRITDKEGKTVHTGVGMRFNGQPIPVPVLMQISFRATDNRAEYQLLQLPAGAYELWPLSQSGAALGAAKTISLTTGEVPVDLTTGPP